MPDLETDFTIEEIKHVRENRDTVDPELFQSVEGNFQERLKNADFSLSDYDDMLTTFDLNHSEQMRIKGRQDLLKKESKIKRMYQDPSTLIENLPKEKQREWELDGFGVDGMNP